MSDHTRTLTAAGVFSLCLMAMTLLPGGSASAQTAAADGSDAAGGADGGGLQEVVVTARRRVENLQDVPIAVTAVSANTLEQRNVTNLQDLNSFVPNFKISADRATNATINVYIRGVGQYSLPGGTARGSMRSRRPRRASRRRRASRTVGPVARGWSSTPGVPRRARMRRL